MLMMVVALLVTAMLQALDWLEEWESTSSSDR